MSFFAIIHDAASSPFEVTTCHINLWSLRRLSGRALFFYDVGLRVKASTDVALSSFQVALPFGTGAGKAWDLRGKLTNHRTVELIFSRKAEIADDGTALRVTLTGADTGGTADMLTILASRIERNERHDSRRRERREFSMWTVTPARPIQPGEDAYLRLRFQVMSSGRMWSWDRAGFGSRVGSLFDLRVADPREALTVTDITQWRHRIVPINSLYVFLIVSSKFVLRVTHPEPYYIRQIEGQAWEQYLGRRTSLWGQAKMSIYEWRKTDEVIGLAQPFRIFIQLGKERHLFPIYSYLITAVTVLAFFFLLTNSLHPSPLLNDIMNWIGAAIRFVRRYILPLILASLGSVVLYVLQTAPPIKWIYDRVKGALTAIDDIVYFPRRVD